MRPSRSACPWRILKISSCLRSPLTPWTPRSLATLFSSEIVLSLSSDRFILLPPPPLLSGELDSGGTAVLGEVRLGPRWEMVVSGGLIVYVSSSEVARPRYGNHCPTRLPALST